jgi:hypothetical protein
MHHQTILNNLQMAHGLTDAECDDNPSRHISLVRTKIEEAMYFLARDMTDKKIPVNYDDILSP